MKLFNKLQNLNTNKDFWLECRDKAIEGSIHLKGYNATNDYLHKIAKYVAYAYDADSPYIGNINGRIDDKKKIFKELGIANEDIVLDLLKNKNEHINKFITWYFKQSATASWEIIITGIEHAQYLLEIVRDKSNTKTAEGNDKLDYDKALKAEQFRHECFKNAKETLDWVKDMNEKMEIKYNNVNKIFKQEISQSLREEMGVAELKSLQYQDYLK